MSADDLIKKHYPGAVLNPDSHEPQVKYDLYGIVGFCGCGIPKATAKWLTRAMCDREFMSDLPDEVKYLINYWIADRGWTEHGTSVNGSWPTEKGKAALTALELIEEFEDGP